MSRYCIVETQLKSLPDHWSSETVTTDQRRVMDVFDTNEDALEYLEENYGMYKGDAEVVPLDSLELVSEI